MKKKVVEAINRNRFDVNESKIKVQDTKNGRRVILGISVDDDLKVPYKTLKKIRASRHLENLADSKLEHLRDLEINEQIQEKIDHWTKKKNYAITSRRGLLEFAKLKDAEELFAKRKEHIDVKPRLLEIFLSTYKKKSILPYIDLSEYVKSLPEIKNGNFRVTNDPFYILGMSQFTTGWTSCMNLNKVKYSKGVWLWLSIEGVSIACLLSEKTKNLAGITKRKMICRSIVYETKDGARYYGKTYGHPNKLYYRMLMEYGFLPAKKGKGKWVKGRISYDKYKNAPKPYFDNARLVKVKDKSTKKRFYRLKL